MASALVLYLISPALVKVVHRLWVNLHMTLHMCWICCLCRCFVGVHPSVGLLHGLHGRADQRSAAGRGRGPTQAQRHPLSLLPPGGRAAITAGRRVRLLQSASDCWRTFNQDPLNRSTKALVKPEILATLASRTYSTARDASTLYRCIITHWHAYIRPIEHKLLRVCCKILYLYIRHCKML